VGKVRLTIEHVVYASSRVTPEAHYVDRVQIDVGGQVQDFPIAWSVQDFPWVVEFTVGPIPGSVMVRARAECNLHGWGDWSTSVPIPEFPALPYSVVTLMGVAVSLLALNKRHQAADREA
jgi:hypothetical protein